MREGFTPALLLKWHPGPHQATPEPWEDFEAGPHTAAQPPAQHLLGASRDVPDHWIPQGVPHRHHMHQAKGRVAQDSGCRGAPITEL